jgi:DNA-binding transcriptional ArsR family regulator
LEQAVRRILLTRRYESDFPAAAMSPDDEFLRQLQAGELEVRTLIGHYCALLYRRFGNFEEVARRTGLDRRTVSKHLRASSSTQ